MQFKIDKSGKSGTLLYVNAALICAQLAFGSFHVVGKYALGFIHPVVFAFYREVIAGPIILLMASVLEGVKVEQQDWWRFGLLGLLTFTTQCSFIVGLKLTNSASQAAIIQQCTPVFTSALSAVLGLESFSFAKLVGLAFAVLGAIVMIGFKDLSHDGASKTGGIMLLLGATLCMSAYYIFQKSILKKYPPITVTGITYTVASMFMGTTALLSVNDLSAFGIPHNVVWPLTYAVLIQTILGYCLLSWANQNAPSSLVALYNCIQPIVAVILATIIFQEQLTWNAGGGMVLVVLGLIVVVSNSKDHALEKKGTPTPIVNNEKSI